MKSTNSILAAVFLTACLMACEDVGEFTQYYIEGRIETAVVTNITHNTAVCGGEIIIERKGIHVKEIDITRGAIYSTDSLGLYNVSFDGKIGNNSFKQAEENGEGAFSCTIDKLKPSTKYYVRAYAFIGRKYVSEKGNSEKKEVIVEDSECHYGDVKSFTTKQAPPDYKEPDDDDPGDPDNVTITTPGTLCEKIGSQKYTITSLKVTGNLNGADMLCIREMVGRDFHGNSTDGKLSTLDLKDVNIVASTINITDIGNWVTSDNTIATNMFSRCSKLTSITLPSSLTTINPSAFLGCTGLSSISIPNSVTEIWNNAFSGCSNLKTVTLEDGSLENNLDVLHFRGSANHVHFNDCPIETLYLGRNITAEVVTTNTNNARNGDPFRENPELKTVTIGPDVTAINAGSFYNCFGLETLDIASAPNLSSIGDWAFFGCAVLTTEIHLPKGFKNIGAGAFQNCKMIPSLTVPNSVTEIWNNAFSGCSNLKTVTLEDGIIENDLDVLHFRGASGHVHFDGCPIETLHLGRNIVAEDTYNTTARLRNGDPFRENDALKIVTVGPDVTEIQPNSFYNCFGLETLELASAPNLTSIGDNAFFGCSSLSTAIHLPQGFKIIGSGAFQNCRKIPSLIVPNSVTEIWNNAFSGCSELKTVTLEDGIIANDLDVLHFRGASGHVHFNGCPIETLYLGRNIVAEDTYNTTARLRNGDPFRENDALKIVTVGPDVTEIQPNSFYNCYGLTNLTIGNRVNTIGAAAFTGTGLTEIHSLNPIAPNATLNCFSNVYSTCKLYVPTGSSDSYKGVAEWKKFFDNDNGFE